MSRPLKNHTELKERILALEVAAKAGEEFLMNEGQRALAIAANPGSFIKDLAQELARDKDFRKDLLRIGLSAGINYLGKVISSPATGDALLSFLLKKSGNQNGSGDGGALKFIARLLEKFRSTKHEQS